MKNSIIIFFILFIVIMVSILFITTSNNEATSEDIKSKVIEELDYLDSKIVGISNQLNNISLKNYTITSEEISLEGQNSESASGSGEGQESSSQESSSKGQPKESNSQNEEEKSNSSITQIEPKPVLSTDENDIDWNSIKNDIEIINEAWAVVIIDLTSLNIQNNDILDFSTTLDACILSIKDENKKDTLTNMAKLYSFIPKFEKGISAPNSNQNIKQIKSYILNAYSLVEQENWDAIYTNISDSEKTFKNLINDIEYTKNKEYKVNKTYIFIKELQNSISNKDKELFYIKYKNLIENINTL